MGREVKGHNFGRAEVDQSNWRQTMERGKIKFDDRAKARFLESFARHGKFSLAAKVAGVHLSTAQNHLRIDPDFQAMVDELAQRRADAVARQLEEEALAGFEEPIYHGKTGELLGHKRVYETPLRLAMLRRYDPEYKDRSETTVSGSVGVLVAPAQMSPQQWIETERERNEDRSEPDRDALGPPPALTEGG